MFLGRADSPEKYKWSQTLLRKPKKKNWLLARCSHKLFLILMGKGFTLIETLLTIVVFTLATSIISGLIILTYRTPSYNWQQSSAVNEARKGVETMVQEIRKARTGEDGSYPI